jgi:hypothetical protein
MLTTKQDIINVIKNDQEYIKEYIEFDEYIFFNFKKNNNHDKFFYHFKFDHPAHGIVNMDRWDGQYFDIFHTIHDKHNKYIILKISINELNNKFENMYHINSYHSLALTIKELINNWKPNKKTEKSWVKELTFIRTYFSPLGQNFNKYLLSIPQGIQIANPE